MIAGVVVHLVVVVLLIGCVVFALVVLLAVATDVIGRLGGTPGR